ncbi:DUF2199 domain-containing protein [Zavarzinia sp. CC-PAN008]|uniref:DUF2199 domain-containing protein n=1 Tax=Zavarzinia sp. CC-PAN008 TaxID=3243332 RepID=UPI003F744BD8
MDYRWTCACCGETFDTMPLDVGCRYPGTLLKVPEGEREARARGNSDFYEVDEHFFVRGVVEVPIIGLDETFCWGVWTSLAEANYHRFRALWHLEEPPSDEPSAFGWLDNWLPGYPPPLEIKCRVTLRPGNQRPSILLEPTDYPLAVEQHRGIDLDRVKAINARVNRH